MHRRSCGQSFGLLARSPGVLCDAVRWRPIQPDTYISRRPQMDALMTAKQCTVEVRR